MRGTLLRYVVALYVQYFAAIFLAVLAIYVYLDATFADVVQSLPSAPTA